MDTAFNQAGLKPGGFIYPPMSALGPTWRGVVVPAHPAQRCARTAALRALACVAAALLVSSAAGAAPFIWDQDDDHIDDRVESVNLLGYSLAFEQGDTLLRKRIDVTRIPGGLAYGVYVTYQQTPTNSDILALAAVGMPVLHR